MSAIIYDQDTRSFSVVETREYGMMDTVKKFGGSAKGFAGSHKVGLINAGTTVAGSAIGAAVARRKAKQAAAARGLQPGTPEYNKFVRNQTLKGAGVGAAAGLATGVVGQAGHAAVSNVLGARKDIRQAGIDAGTGPGKMTFKQMRQAAWGNDKYGAKSNLNAYKISNPLKKK